MQAGKLRNKVKIQQQTTDQDAAGQPLDTWSDVANVWGNIRFLNGVETLKAGAPTSTAKASIRIRYRTGINAGMRVLHGATAYNITAVLPDMAKKEYVDLACEDVSG